MTQRELDELKVELKTRLINNNISSVLDALEEIIPLSCLAKFNTLILLKRDFNLLQSLGIKGTTSTQDLDVKQASFLDNLMNFIDGLILEDLENQPTPASSSTRNRVKNKTGSVLYSLPSKMEVGKERKCVVRLSFDESFLLDNIKPGKDLHVKTIRRIDERMEVSLVDPNEEKTFSVRTLNSLIQKVERDDYTEWLYFIKPLKEGVHDIWLKVAVIIVEEDEKIRKEIVLQERVEVVTEIAGESDLGMELKRAGMIFTIGLPTAGGAAGGGMEDGSAAASVAAATQTGSVAGGGSLAAILSTTTGKIISAAASILLLGGLYYFGTTLFSPSSNVNTPNQLSANEQNVSDPDEAKSNQLAQITPLEGIGLNREVFSIDPGRDTTLKTISGSTYNIRANSLVDETGNLISDDVEINIEEIIEPHEVIASGIPMRFFEEAMKERWFQTAGMFNITAVQNGKVIQVANGKSIDVKLVSMVDGPYDFWQFDNTKGNWEYLQKAPIPERISSINPKLSREIETLRLATAKQPMPPKIYKTYRYETDKINLSCCPELEPEDNDYLYLTFAGKDESMAPENNDWIRKRKWLNRTLEKSTLGEGVYKMTWEGDTIFHTYLKLAEEAKDVEKSKARYDSLSQVYKNNLALLRQKESLIEEQYAFQRSVQVQGFGIYNFDVFWNKDDIISLRADFDLGPDFNVLKKATTIYLITADQRSVIKFNYQQWQKFRYSPSEDNQLLALLPGKRIAVFTQNDFDSEEAAIADAGKARKTYTFKMRLIDKELSSLNELEQTITNSKEI